MKKGINKKIKVCMITGSFPGRVCGVGDYSHMLTSALNKRDIETSVVTTDEEIIKKKLKDLNFKVLPVIKTWGWGELFKLIETIKKLKPDVVHIQYQTSIYNKKSMILFLPLMIKILLKDIRVFTTLHDIEGPYLFPGARGLHFSRWSLSMLFFSDKTITSSKKNKKTLSKTLFFIRSFIGEIEIMPVGPNLPCEASPDFDPLKTRHSLGLKENCFLIATFGFIEASRNYTSILKAIKILSAKNLDVHLIAIGGKSKRVLGFTEYYKELQNKITSEGLSDYVTFTGYCTNNEASDIILSSDIGVLLFSDPDYLPLSGAFPFLISHSLPLIVSDGKFLPEWLKNGENIVLVKPGNHEALAKKIESLFSKESRKKIGKKAEQLYKEYYSFEKIAEKTATLYSSSLSN